MDYTCQRLGLIDSQPAVYDYHVPAIAEGGLAPKDDARGKLSGVCFDVLTEALERLWCHVGAVAVIRHQQRMIKEAFGVYLVVYYQNRLSRQDH